MKRKARGSVSIATILLIAVIAIAIIAIILLLLGFGGLGFGGGKGDGEGDGSVMADATVETTTLPEETTIATNEIIYTEVTISENSYIYQNREISLDDLIAELVSTEEKTPVKITDDNASQKAYTQLINALKENNIRYIEVTANGNE